MQTASVAATKPQPQPLYINDMPPLTTAKGLTSTEEAQSKMCLLRWKGRKKINQIYGDWLDDLPLVQNLPNEVDTALPKYRCRQNSFFADTRVRTKQVF